MTGLTIRKVGPDELEILLAFSKSTFFTAFYHLNNPEDMEAYADKFFTIQQFQKEISNPNSAFYFAMWGNDIAGYIKLNFGQAQTEFQDATSLEVERIYVGSAHQGKKIGNALIDFAVQTAHEKQLKAVWLGVWESNHRAVKFYQQNGFEVFDNHYFMLGNDKQRDLLMKRVL
jgi:ribosomal protein S18 acetylase RimI-like enzyme